MYPFNITLSGVVVTPSIYGEQWGQSLIGLFVVNPLSHPRWVTIADAGLSWRASTLFAARPEPFRLWRVPPLILAYCVRFGCVSRADAAGCALARRARFGRSLANRNRPRCAQCILEVYIFRNGWVTTVALCRSLHAPAIALQCSTCVAPLLGARTHFARQSRPQRPPPYPEVFVPRCIVRGIGWCVSIGCREHALSSG